jgi:BirA family biotin operon repressor/biotin-[acetyl-CoA-carboxylase] ligase
MQLIDADKAQEGMTIVARQQTAGRGQRGKAWIDAPGQSLLMSIISMPGLPIGGQFAFNASITVAIVKVLQNLYSRWDVLIKWPNDIIVNDKKAGGVLIENILRGSRWTHSVIGIGINVLHRNFPAELPFATSLRLASDHDFDINALANQIREQVLASAHNQLPADASMKMYNQYLYKKGKKQLFTDNKKKWEATLLGVQADGRLQVQLASGDIVFYQHGQAEWVWG